MNRLKVSSLIFAVGLTAAGQSFAGTCDAVIADLVNWNKTPEVGYQHTVGFQLATVASGARWVAHMNGQLVNSGSGLTVQTPSTQLFSDRLGSSGSCSGPFCFSNQPFTVSKPDATSIAIGANGVITYTLNTWGNNTATFSGTCANNFMYATAADAFLTLSFVKNRVQIPK